MERRQKPGLRRRFPVVNGIFYPECPETAASQIASWGLKTGPAGGGQTILAPHGAWDLTGGIAASAFAAVQKKNGIQSISRVLLLGTHHNAGEEGIYLSESAFFGHPRGDLPVDQKFNRRLASCSPLIKLNDIPHLSEHSLEVLLPLVKYCFSEVKIVPILMGGRKPALISALAGALKTCFESCLEESLIIVSSTVSQNSDPAVAFSMADEFSSILENMDTRTFFSRLAGGRISACGGAILGALLESGLLEGKRFTSLCPMQQSIVENGETVYYGAFGA
ncbi:MAG: AmmeMemoRadiSam system protein B [Treponema sp.]|jgi:AmmeMemoRadiSam system protein B|nr:AmmeMemoRadiSam system protein B [Treponema sp.]